MKLKIWNAIIPSSQSISFFFFFFLFLFKNVSSLQKYVQKLERAFSQGLITCAKQY